MRILLVDDDELLTEVISQHLIKQRYAVDIADTGQMALDFVSLFNYDLVVLDVILPDLDGRDICVKIRENKHQMPILMLTAQKTSEDTIKGLDAGADDYLIKPIQLAELMARVRALLRRPQPTASPLLQWGQLQLDPISCETKFLRQKVALTPKEYAILELFLRNTSRTHTLDAIIDNIWSLENPPSLYAVRTHIKSLRQKLKREGAAQDFIETVYGFGYRLNPIYQNDSPNRIEDLTPPEPAIPENATHHHAPELISAEVSALTRALWAKNQGEMQSRLQVLKAVAQAIQANALTAELKQQGTAIAHKLAGSLGCFGFPEGSTYAKKIELSLIEHPTLQSQELHNQVLPRKQSREINSLLKQLQASIDLSPKLDSFDQNPFKLLVYSLNFEFLRYLSEQSEAEACQTMLALTPKELLSQIKIHHPHVILLDLAEQQQTFEAIEALEAQSVDIPVMVVLHEGEWSDRLDFVHRGIRRIFEAPVTAQDIFEGANQVYQSTHTRAKLLIVDDDLVLLSLMEKSLSALGYQVLTLGNPLEFWPALARTNPDLLILDVEMPAINGFELCQMVRADPHWNKLPVLFLTTYEDPQKQNQAFSVGADDFIHKPIQIQHLAHRLQNRLR